MKGGRIAGGRSNSLQGDKDVTALDYHPGDWVIFRKEKHSTSPGPRAENIHAAPKGDDYYYQVDKFWVVAETRPDGKVVLRTRRGKTHVVNANDPHLRRARWWERLFYRSRFPSAGRTNGCREELSSDTGAIAPKRP
jgi:hypothetical protein